MNQPPKQNGRSYDSSVTLTDEAGRSLCCYIEQSFEIDSENYVLLMPVDTPIDILALHGDEEAEDATLATEEEIDLIFDTAKAVLGEYNLKLQRTALTLTVLGEIPEWDEEEVEEEAGDQEYEELLSIANFYHDEQEYAICTPLDPFFILARLNEFGEPELLSKEDYQKLEPMMPYIESLLEDQLFADLD